MSWVRSIGARAFIAGMAFMGLVYCDGPLAVAIHRSGEVHLLSDRRTAGVVAQGEFAGHRGNTVGELPVHTARNSGTTFAPNAGDWIASTLAQFYWKPARRVKLVQLIFDLSQVTVSSAVAYGAYQLVVIYVLHAPGPLALLVRHHTLRMQHGGHVSIIGLTEDKPIPKVWTASYLWSFPYYMVGAAAAGLVHFLNRHIGWQSSLLILPPIY